VFVTGIRNKAHEKVWGAYKRVRDEKNIKIFRYGFCKELVVLWRGF
jgi:hypothetical protein